MIREKFFPSLLNHLEKTSRIPVLVKIRNPEEFDLAAAVARGDAPPPKESPADRCRMLQKAVDACQEGCARFLEERAEKDQRYLSEIGLSRPRRRRSRRSLWINNSIVTEATPETICHLSDRDDVELIHELRPHPRLEAESGTARPESRVTWGLERLRIPEIWARGFRGTGVRVGHLDTGVDGAHPDLDGRIEKFLVAALDARLFEFSAPFDQGVTPFDSDPGSHGTHTAGTIVGGDTSGTAIGVAPEARLFSGLVIEGGQALDRVLAGMEWVAQQTDMSVLSMSLGFPPGEAFEDVFEDAVNNLVFLDIFPAIAIGNEGVNTSRAPGINVQSWSVGATDANDQVASFSGGQMVARASDRIQPDMTAPGVDTLSAVRGGQYEFYSGSSMATPHVAGVVALLRQAAPGATVGQIKQVLAETALDQGPFLEDIRFGWGRIQPVDALDALLS